MKSFVIIRVPVVRDENRDPVRRNGFGTNPTIVAELDSIDEAGSRLAELQQFDDRHHYYGLEVRLTGGPGRRTANVVESAPARTTTPRIAIDNSKGKKQ